MPIKSKSPATAIVGLFISTRQIKARERKLVVEIIAVVLQKVEVVMEKHGYWKVTGAILMGIFIWQLSNIINAFVALAKVFQ